MCDNDTVGAEFELKRDKIREFLRRPTHKGGILLVTGQRGTGKTRLVEEALSSSPKYSKAKAFISHALGESGKRTRYQVIRKPRLMKRHLLKIDVDPFFPHTSEDLSEVESLFLRNIICALTNTMDCRYSTRRHGRVLRERLGFFRYWFGNALIWPTGFPIGVFVLVFFLLLILQLALINGIEEAFRLAAFVYNYALSGGTTTDYQSIINLFFLDNSIVFLVIDIWVFLAAFIFMRRRDLKALSDMNMQLYDLVHAQNYQKERATSREAARDSRYSLIFPLVFLMLSGLSLFFGPEILRSSDTHPVNPNPDKLNNADMRTGNTNDGINELVSGIKEAINSVRTSSPPNQGESNNARRGQVETNSRDRFLQMAVQLLLLFLTAFSIIFSSSLKTKDGDRSSFDPSNPAWRVNLLRRYLFLCHRCGLEPVLVLDELDKLEELDEFPEQQQIKSIEKADSTITTTSMSVTLVSSPNKKDKLVLFLKALARLKASLGAEFLWILIGGPRIYGYLQEHRHEREDGNLGLLATVIHQEVVLGPIGFPDAYKYLRSQSKKRAAPPGENITIREGRNVARVAWLRTYGNISTLTRVAEEMLNTPRLQDYPITPLAVLLAKYVRVLWSPRAMAEQVDLRTQLEYRDKVREEWVIAWVRSGMLDMANRFMKDPPPYDYFEKALREGVERRLQRKLKDAEPPEIPAILTGDPQLLRLVGASMLYRRLVRDGFVVPQHGAWAMQPDIKFQNLPPLG